MYSRSTGGPPVRNATQTRGAVLEAARRALRERGVQVSLGTIAKAAGVSKGGLLHHFRTKDELFLALVQDVYKTFEVEVRRYLETEREGPGKLARSYVRAICMEFRESNQLLQYATSLHALYTVEPAVEYAHHEIGKWRAALDNDSIDPHVVALIFYVIDGIAGGFFYGAMHSSEDIDALETRMIRIIDRDREFAELLEDSRAMPP